MIGQFQRCYYPRIQFFETSVIFDVACVSVYFRVPDTITTLMLLKRLTNFDKISDVIRDRGVDADGVSSRVDTVI